MAQINLFYGIDETEAMRSAIQDVANDWSVGGAGIENVTVVSGSGKASIDNDTLYLDFPTVSSDIDTSTFITSASINSGTVSVEDNTLLINIPTVEAITLNGAEVNNITIVGAGIVTAEGKNATLALQNGTRQKLNPALTVTPDEITFADYSPVNVTISTASDGSISAEAFGDIDISETETLNVYEITPNNQGDSKVKFFVGETYDYFYSGKILSTSQNNPMPYALFHFNDSMTDEGGNSWTVQGTPKYVAAEFGNGLTKESSTSELFIQSNSLQIGGMPFTVDFYCKATDAVGGATCFELMSPDSSVDIKVIHSPGSGWDFQVTTPTGTIVLYPAYQSVTSMFHYALTYKGGVLRLFQDGKLLSAANCTIPRFLPKVIFGTASPYCNAIFDELHINPVQAVWTSNFTPPTQPYAGE